MTQARYGLEYDGHFVSTKSHAIPITRPGEVACIPTREGYRSFVYLHASEAFAIGQVASEAGLIYNADVDQIQAIGDKIMKGTGDFTANEFNDGSYRAGIVSFDAGTGLNQTRAIKNNRGSTDYLNLDKGYDVALDLTTDFVVQDLELVRLADTDEDVPFVKGVAICAVTSSEWSWFQYKGYCPLVRSAGDTDALVYGESIVPSGAAGVARGLTNGATTADEVAQAFGVALHASAAADSAGRGVAAMLNCRYASGK